MNKISILRGFSPELSLKDGATSLKATLDLKQELGLDITGKSTISRTHLLDNSNLKAFQIKELESILLIPYQQECFSSDFINILEKVCTQEDIKKTYKEIILIPLQGVVEHFLYNGPIVHMDIHKQEVLNFVGSGDACCLGLNLPSNNQQQGLSLNEVSNLQSSFMDHWRFLFQQEWQETIHQSELSIELVILLFMLRNTQPDARIYISGGNNTWPREFKRYLQNLGVDFASTAKKASDTPESLNTTSVAKTNNLLKTIKTFEAKHYEMLQEINLVSDVIPEALGLQFGFSINENKYR